MASTDLAVKLIMKILEMAELVIVILLIYKLIKLVTVGTSKVNNIKKNKKDITNLKDAVKEVENEGSKIGEEEPSATKDKKSEEVKKIDLNQLIHKIKNLKEKINLFLQICILISKKNKQLNEEKEAYQDLNGPNEEDWEKFSNLNITIKELVEEINKILKNICINEYKEQKENIKKLIDIFTQSQIKYQDIITSFTNNYRKNELMNNG